MPKARAKLHPKIVTVDGPAASGKTSVSRALAQALGWSWVSTGAFYRGLAYFAQREGVPLDDAAQVAALIGRDDWQVKMTAAETLVLVRGEDVSAEINAETVGNGASQISQYPDVRKALLQAQRDCANEVKGLVAEGRDCGTVVFPEAPVKFYLTARSRDRAQRRAAEQGLPADELLKEQKLRDAQDSGRKVAPLQAAEGAHIIDSSELSLEQVVARVEQIVRQELALA